MSRDTHAMQVDSNTESRHRRIQAVVQAVESLDLVDFPATWSRLDALSTQTYVDGIAVDPAGISLQPADRFTGVASIYLLLSYGPANGKEGFETSDAFLGRFDGYFDKEDRAVVRDITVDTAPFYDSESA